MAQESELKTRVREIWHAVWDDGDVDALDALLADGYTRTSNASPAALGAGEFKDMVRTTREAFPDFSTTITALAQDGDQLAIFWSSTGTHSSELFGVPATHRRITTYGSNFCTFDNGRLVNEHVTWDPRQLLTALGIISLGED
ncbi:ester cyclase [Arthrobacter sp. 35W]|uniref:ester cyclase n=1 Tax=Arthrobacter sp. 35W TaxID=1132441 RepID=UPI000429580B|nr:ester cyclase [Arthrobacter sp. 35W]